MKKILILQNTIMEYRKPVYNGLTKWYDVTVLHAGPESAGPNDRYHEIIVPRIQLGPFKLQNEARIRQYILSYDAVIAMFDLRWPSYLLPLLTCKQRPRFILWGHRYSSNALVNRCRDFLMKFADRLLMYGDEEVDRMAQRGIDREKIIIAWNTIHVPNHHDTSGNKKNGLLFIGRLQPSKKIYMLIDALANLQGKVPEEITVEIIGDGEEELRLRNVAVQRKIIDKVNFYGRIDDPKILCSHFKKALTHVSPGPIGLSALHSMAYGVPVIANVRERNGPEVHNLRHEHNALLVESQIEMEQAIEKLCNDRVYAERLGHNAYLHYVKNRSLALMLDGFRIAIEE